MRCASLQKLFAASAAIVMSALALPLAAQANPSKTEKPEEAIETITVDFASGKPLAGLPAAEIMDVPVRCSQSGTTFYDIYADSSSPKVAAFPQLYAIDHLGNVRHLARNLPPNYRDFNVLSVFPSSQALVSLIQANVKLDPFDPKANKTFDRYIVLSNDDGTSSNPIKVVLNFSAYKIAALESGRFVVLGFDEVNHVPGLAILESDGTIHKTLDLDNREYQKDKTVNSVLSATKGAVSRDLVAMTRSLSFAEFLPDGPNVILLQGTTGLPAKVISDEGEVSEFTLSPPFGFVVKTVLASDPKGPIVAALQNAAELSKSLQEGVSKPNEPLAEFSRDTGKLIKWIKVTGVPFPENVSCATNGELTAIYWPPEEPKAAADTPDTSAKDHPSTDKPPHVDQLLFAKAPF